MYRSQTTTTAGRALLLCALAGLGIGVPRALAYVNETDAAWGRVGEHAVPASQCDYDPTSNHLSRVAPATPSVKALQRLPRISGTKTRWKTQFVTASVQLEQRSPDVGWTVVGERKFRDSNGSEAFVVNQKTLTRLGGGVAAFDVPGRGRDNRTRTIITWYRPNSSGGVTAYPQGRARVVALHSAALLDGQTSSYCVGSVSQRWWGDERSHFGSEPDFSAQMSGGHIPFTGDFDGDGRGDLFWLGSGAAIEDEQWWGNYDRGRTTAGATKVVVAGDEYQPSVGDFDGDGKDDIFWYGDPDQGQAVWWGNSDRNALKSGSTGYSVGGTEYVTVTGDFDGDGRDDIFWYGGSSYGDAQYWGNPERDMLKAGMTKTAVEGTEWSLAGGDFNGDGRDDVLFYDTKGVYEASVVWWGNPKRDSLKAGYSRYRAEPGHIPVVGDFDGDGRDDVLWYSESAETYHAWWGSPVKAEFGQKTTPKASLPGRYEPLVEDFDGDGKSDIFWYGIPR